jgi:hypothetical protein
MKEAANGLLSDAGDEKICHNLETILSFASNSEIDRCWSETQ